MRFPAILLPLALLMIAQVGVLFATANFARLPFSLVMVPAIEATFGESALHYPANYYILRDMFDVFRLPVLILFGYLMIGWCVFMIIDVFQGRAIRFTRYGTELFMSVPSLLVIGLVLVAIDVVSKYAADAITAWTTGAASSFLMVAVAIAALVAKALFVYSVFFLRYYGRSTLEALRASINFGRKRLILTVMILATAALIEYMVDRAATGFFTTAVSGTPESMVHVLLVGTAAQLGALYFLLTSTTYLALGRRGK